MSKLLHGQSLYMAKSIIAQQASELVESPPFEPPIIRGVPCITTRSIYGDIVDVTSLKLVRLSPPTWQFAAEKIAPASFLFRNLPENFPSSFLHVNNMYSYHNNSPHFTTANQLRIAHWFTMYPQIGVNVTHWPPYYEEWYEATEFPSQYWTIEDHCFRFTKIYNDELYSCLIHWTWTEFDTAQYTVNEWQMPPNSIMWIAGQVANVGQRRDEHGVYHPYP